jgi:hypothetical protein
MSLPASFHYGIGVSTNHHGIKSEIIHHGFSSALIPHGFCSTITLYYLFIESINLISNSHAIHNLEIVRKIFNILQRFGYRLDEYIGVQG